MVSETNITGGDLNSAQLSQYPT